MVTRQIDPPIFDLLPSFPTRLALLRLFRLNQSIWIISMRQKIRSYKAIILFDSRVETTVFVCIQNYLIVQIDFYINEF